jgi:hypothetical protein
MVSAPWLRAEVLRVLHKATSGMPLLSSEEAAQTSRVTKRDRRFMLFAVGDDFDLINECLLLEHELREQGFATLERLLWWTQWSEGDLDDRLVALPAEHFARAALDLYELGWVDATRGGIR